MVTGFWVSSNREWAVALCQIRFVRYHPERRGLFGRRPAYWWVGLGDAPALNVASFSAVPVRRAQSETGIELPAVEGEQLVAYLAGVPLS